MIEIRPEIIINGVSYKEGDKIILVLEEKVFIGELFLEDNSVFLEYGKYGSDSILLTDYEDEKHFVAPYNMQKTLIDHLHNLKVVD